MLVRWIFSYTIAFLVVTCFFFFTCLLTSTYYTVVWNPWIEKAKAMSDFQDDGYLNMVCVEVGTVAAPITLAPGATWTGHQLMTAY